MGGNHLNNTDPRPKRRKDKDNPYEIFTTGLGTAQPHYFLAFVDSTGAEQCVEIDKALFDAFDRFELDDISFMHKVDKHYERLEQTEESLHKRAFHPPMSVEELVTRQIEVDDLHRAIAQLPEKQHRRLVLYYFGGCTYEQIAEMEGCKYQTVQDSIYAALKNRILHGFLRLRRPLVQGLLRLLRPLIVPVHFVHKRNVVQLKAVKGVE